MFSFQLHIFGQARHPKHAKVDYLKAFVIISLFLFCGPLLAQNSNWTLQQCIDTALKNNISVQQSENTTEFNKITLAQHKLNRYPTLNGNAGESYDFKNSGSNVSLSGAVILFNGFRNKNNIKQSQFDLEASKYDLETQKKNITLDVVDGYLQILYAEELVKNSQSSYEAVQSQYNQIKEFVVVGKKSESDLLQIKSELAGDKLTLVNAQGQLRSAKVNLLQIMNVAITNNFDILYPLAMEPDTGKIATADYVYDLALTRQPEIRSAEFKTKSETAGLNIIKGSEYPVLSLGGNVGTNYLGSARLSETTYQSGIQNIGYLQSNPNELVMGNVAVPVYNYLNYPFGDQLKDNFTKSLSLSLSIPIYNNHAVKNNIRKQEITLKNAVLDEQKAKNDLRNTIEQAYTDVENAIAKYSAAKEKEAAGKASYDNAKSKYDNSMLSMSDLLQELNTYSQAQSESIQARYELIYDLKILDYYKGIPLTF